VARRRPRGGTVAYRGERDPTTAERAELVGTYTTGQATIVVTEANGALQLRQPVGRTIPARLSGDGSRLVGTGPADDAQLPYVIVRDAEGRVRFLYRNARAYTKRP